MGWELNKQDTTQVIAYAATITPDSVKGDYIVVGALTGALTVNAPTNPVAGAQLTFDLTQDGTGGRVVTWDAVFKAASFVPNTAAGKRNVVTFRYDGTNWVAVAWVVDVATATNYVKAHSQAITGALSTVADAPAKAVLTSIISNLVALGVATDGTS